MATKTKSKKVPTKKLPKKFQGSERNNTMSRKEQTAQEGKCQWCLKEVPLKDQFVVYNDLESETVIKAKDATKPKHERKSHYCGECADKRKATKEKGDFKKRAERAANSPKKGGGKKAKAKAKPKATKKAPKRKPPKKGAKAKGKAKTAAAPF
jgi:hypothetical protein